MLRNVRRDLRIASLAGVLVLALALASGVAASAIRPSPSWSSVAALQKRTTATTQLIAVLERRAGSRGRSAGLRRRVRAADRAVLVLSRTAVGLSRAALAGDPDRRVVRSLIAIDSSVVSLGTRAAKLTLRTPVLGRRHLAARILGLRRRVARCGAGLRDAGAADPQQPAPSPTDSPGPSATPGVASFPAAALPGVSLASLPEGYETSGVAWHPRLQRLLTVSDEGVLSMLRLDGGELVHRSVPGDLEGICIADPQTDLVYIGVEHPDSILEVDLASATVLRRFDLTQWMQGPSNRGLEALAFVPVAARPEGGVFYAGLQDDGRIYMFELPIVTSRISTRVTHLGVMTLEEGLTDLAGLSYDPDSGVLLAVFDGPDRLKTATPDGRLLREWEMPGTDQEGVAWAGGTLFIGEDHGSGGAGRIMRYAPFVLPQ